MDVKKLGEQVLAQCRKQGWAVLETGISRPVPRIVNGQVQLGYLLYRSQVQPPYQMLYEPFGRVAVDFVTGKIIDYQPLPTSVPAKALGRYPHAVAAALPRDQWQDVWDELFQLYPDVIDAYAGYAKPSQRQQVARFRELFALTMPPYLGAYYRALNPLFFDWMQQAA